MKRLVIVSLDLMLALPIVSIAFILLFSGIRGSQSYLLSSANFRSGELGSISASQEIAGALDASSLNFSGGSVFLRNLSEEYGVNATLSAVSPGAACTPSFAVCRLVTLSSSVYILVVRYENTS